MRSRFGRAGESFVRGPAAALHPIPVTNGEISGSPIPLQFPLSPMRFFAIEIEHAGFIAVDCLQYGDTRVHDRPAAPRGQDQSLDGGLPFGRHVLGLWKLGDVVPGGLQRQKLATAGERYRIVESLLPALGHQANNSEPAARSDLINRAYHSAGFDRSAVLHQDLG